MGRIFETRKATMFARWNKMSKAFTRVARDIHMAVRAGGPHPETNAALRRAILNGRALNMPKDKLETAIKRGLGVDTANYEEAIYEGYAGHGVQILVVAATDNPTRTVANVRMHFNKGGGNLGSTGSVAFNFSRLGVFRLDPEAITVPHDEFELDLIDHGLEEMGDSTGEKGEAQVVIRCALTDFGKLQSAIEERGITPVSVSSEFIPQTHVDVTDEQANEVFALIDRLEQDEDVQQVFHNMS